MTAFGYSSETVTRGQGSDRASYIARSGKYESGPKTSREDLVATGYGNLPPGFEDADEFWAAADAHTRAGGRVADTRILTLPRGLDAAQQERAVMRFTKEWCGEDHAYTWAIHNPEARDGDEQPHGHIMRSPKINDGIERDEPGQFFRNYNSRHPERGGARTSATTGLSREVRAAAMMAEREGWAEICNDALAAAGVLARVDARSNAARGLMREPEPKLRRDQRSDPEALAALDESRATWKQAADADARVTMLEEASRHRRAASAAEDRLANAERPREVPEAPRAGKRTRQDRYAAAKAARERQVEARVDDAKRPREVPEAPQAGKRTRQDRYAAAKAAKERHQLTAEMERRVESQVTAQVDHAKRPRDFAPVAAQLARPNMARQDRGAALTGTMEAYRLAFVAREAAAAAQAEADRAAAQGAKEAAAAQEAKEAERRAEATRAALEARTKEAPAKEDGGGNRILKRVAGLFSRAVESVTTTTPAPVQTGKPIIAPSRQVAAAPIVAAPRPVPVAPVARVPAMPKGPTIRVTAAPTTQPAAAPAASKTEAATPAEAKPPYTQKEAEDLLRAGGVIQISADGKAAVFRPTAAESAEGPPLPGVGWTRKKGLAGLEALLAREGVEPSRKEPARDGAGLVEYSISDLARLLSTKARSFAAALIDRMQIATFVSQSRSGKTQGAATPAMTVDAPKPTPSPAKKPRAPSRDRGGWERD